MNIKLGSAVGQGPFEGLRKVAQGLKPDADYAAFAARLKSRPDTSGLILKYFSNMQSRARLQGIGALVVFQGCAWVNLMSIFRK